MWFIYIVRCSDNSLYTGITNNLLQRIEQHNSGNIGSKYTRAHRPVTLVYQEEATSRSKALKREAAIKKLPREKKEVLIKK